MAPEAYSQTTGPSASRRDRIGHGTLISAAMEVNCGHESIDNLFLTPTGDIILVETKLWSNAEARREVAAQALDYAHHSQNATAGSASLWAVVTLC